MKLNNKGFAITAVLYGLLILFVILVSSYLLVLSAKKDRIDTLINGIESDYNIKDEKNPILITEHIATLYNSALKTEITNNNIKYNYAPSVSLMNDRLGGITDDYDGGNIRYYGANPNNYIYFNCDNYNNQSDITCEKWRIIGIVEGKLKIIKAEPIGEFSWDYDYNNALKSETYTNDWTTSSLNTFLNGPYYNNQDNTTYYSAEQYISGRYQKKIQTINFKTDNIGIKNNTTQNLISEHVWNLGGVSELDKKIEQLYANDLYVIESEKKVYDGHDAEWTGKIALMSLSDFAFSADLSSCINAVDKYYNEGCISWLPISHEYDDPTWFLTPRSNNSNLGWKMYSNKEGYGYIWSSGNNDTHVQIYKMGSIRPTLYLNTDIAISDGNGSATAPYKILIQN